MRRAAYVVGLLTLSNTFMNFAWYGHLRFKTAPLVLAILASWLIALPEYALQVPANRCTRAVSARIQNGSVSTMVPSMSQSTARSGFGTASG